MRAVYLSKDSMRSAFLSCRGRAKLRIHVNLLYFSTLIMIIKYGSVSLSFFVEKEKKPCK
jgi:hypothetical protein